MLPLGFKRLGVDPGIASSPFVATFVDVTGIMIYFSIASSILLVGAAGDSDETAREWNALGGVWKVTATETDGDTHRAEDDWEKRTDESMYFVFANDKLIIIDPLATPPHKKPEPAEYNISLDPSQSPRTIDAVSTDGKKSKKLMGIYEIKGGILRICWSDGEAATRPTSFEAPADSNLTMWTLTRSKR